MSQSSSNAMLATAQVAGYGKHPAWSDHIEGLGAASSVLSKIEGELYLGAIGSLITSGDWPAASSGHAMAKTVRRLVWQNAGDLVFGWMWPSADQVGRDHYPMILCVHVTGVDADQAVPVLDPLLRQAMQAICATRVREDVVTAVQDLQAQARKVLQTLPPESEEVQPKLAGEWIKSGPLDTTRWQRLLYFLKTQYADAAITETGGRLLAIKRSGSNEFEGMRLPCPASAGLAGLTGWLAFLHSQLRANVPTLLIQPEGAEWCDVIVGAVNSTTLKPILGGLPEVYPVTDVPFEISPEFAVETEQVLQSVSLAWGNPQKVSIFGPVASRYRPYPAVGRPASGTPKPSSVESSTAEPKPEAAGPAKPVSASRSIPWILIGAGALVLVLLVGTVAFLMLRSSSAAGERESGEKSGGLTNTAGPAVKGGSVAENASKNAVDGGDYPELWKNYWEQYGKLNQVAAAAEPGSLWEKQVQDSLRGLEPKNWEPWVVVFGGKDKVRGAEIENISKELLKAQAGNLRRGADAASRLMAAATNGYAAGIRSLISGLAEGPAAGLEPVWKTALAAPADASRLPDHVQALVALEARWRQISSRVEQWSAVWSKLAPVESRYVELIRSNDLAAIRQLRDPVQVIAAMDASIAAATTTRAWAESTLPKVDASFLAASLSKAGSGMTWNVWSNSVAGAVRAVDSADVAALKEAIRAEAEGERLKFLVRVRKDQGDAIRKELASLSERFAEVSQTPLVQAEPAAVSAFRNLQAGVASAGERLQKAWALVASPKAQVQLSRDARKLASPLQEQWLNYLELAARKAEGEASADAAASTRRWAETLDAAWAFFSALETADRDSILTRPRHPFAGRVSDEVWRRDAREALQAIALDPGTLRFRMEAPAALAAIQREATGVVAVANAAQQINTAWADGQWTNTATAREIVTKQPALPVFQASLKAFNVGRLRSLAADTWSKPIPESGPVAGADLISISAVCERIGAEQGWATTDARWKTACDLAGFVGRAGTWKNLERQKAWFTRLWQARVGGGLAIDSAASVTMPLSGQPELESWLPAGYATHKRWAQIAAALQGGQLNEARRLVEVLHADTAAGKLPDSPANRAVLDQLATLKLPEDPFLRVDWDRTRDNRPFKFEVNEAGREAVAVFPSGIRISFVLPPPGVAAAILIAREEFSARDLAVLLNGNPGLSQKWAALVVADLKTLRKATADPHVAGVWNNLGITPVPQVSSKVPRIMASSLYKGADIRSFGAEDADLPANCISAEFAEAVAAVLGCRLPASMEWTDINSRMGGVSFQCRPKAVKALSDDLVSRWEAKNERSSLVTGALTTASASPSPEPAVPDRGSGPFFQPVTAGSGADAPTLRHWAGNVAEYLRDPQSGALSVAGGSFANGTIRPQPLDEKTKAQAYIDAGLRLALDRIDLDQLGQAKAMLAQIRLVVP